LKVADLAPNSVQQRRNGLPAVIDLSPIPFGAAGAFVDNTHQHRLHLDIAGHRFEDRRVS
jgi:hypothetical protein